MSLNIPLGSNYYLLSDSRQYIISEFDGKKQRPVAYFVNIEMALKFLIERRIRGLNSKSILSLMESIKLLQAEFDEVVQPLRLEVRVKKGVINGRLEKTN